MELKLYAESLRNIYKKRAAGWKELDSKHEASKEKLASINAVSWEALGSRAKKESMLEDIRAQIEDEKKKMDDFKAESRRLINAETEDFKKDLKAAFLPDGNAIDEGIMRAIMAGVQYEKNELKTLEEKYKRNPTMLRVLHDYSKAHNVVYGSGIPVVNNPKFLMEKMRKEFDEAARFTLYGCGGSPLWQEETLFPALEELKQILSFEG